MQERLPESADAREPVVVLTIAGSDSGGGAGVQADIKAISALGGFAASAITAITAQNTQGVQAILPVSEQMIAAQCDSVLGDMKVRAIKIGMLPNQAAVQAVAQVLARFRVPQVVWDPVMVATSGDALTNMSPDEACALMLPHCSLVTPNLAELARLTHSEPARNDVQLHEQAKLLLNQGARAVLAKGGHLKGAPIDWLIWPHGQLRLDYPRIDSRNTHGTGCTYAAAIATRLAQGLPLNDAVASARAYLQAAIAAGAAWRLGQGRGPVHHFVKA